MFESLTNQLTTILDQLTLLVDQHASLPISPVLLIHPPTLRSAHAAFLQRRQDELGSMLPTIIDIEKKATAVRTSIYRHQRGCSFARTPVSALPDEILCSIFSFAVKGGEDYSTIQDSIYIAIDISKVSRKWHTVAINLRTLWTNIRLSCGDVRRVDTILRRSVQEPIDLRITDALFISASDCMSDVAQDRLRTLSINCEDDVGATLRRLLDRDCDSYEFRTLESLSLSEGGPSLSIFPLDRMFKFPKLRELKLHRTITLYGLHAENLTTLEICLSSYVPIGNGLCDFLARCPRLQKMLLFTNMDYSRARHDPFSPIVTLEDLRSLEIQHVSRRCLVDILSCFRAPHLESFTLLLPETGNSERDNDSGDSSDDETGVELGLSIRETLRRTFRKFVSYSSGCDDHLKPSDQRVYHYLAPCQRQMDPD